MQTKVTPIVEGYGGWAFRLEIVPMESSYPGYGKLVVSFWSQNHKKKKINIILEMVAGFLIFYCSFSRQVLESTDHVNICKPISRNDPSYSETLHLLQKLRARIREKTV